jgi:hypothetical protein
MSDEVYAEREEAFAALMRQNTALASVGNEILEIMRTRDEQEAQGIYGGTPRGLEHMGDVWRLLDRWRDTIRAALAGRGRLGTNDA